MEGLGLDKYKQSRINLVNMSLAYLKGGSQGVMNLIDEKPLTIEEQDYLDQIVKSSISDAGSAIFQTPMPWTPMNLAIKSEGSYYGQNVDQLGSEWRNRYLGDSYGDTRKEWNAKYERHDIEPSPDIMNIFLGQKTPSEEGMRKLDVKPNDDYPYRGEDVWDLSPHMSRSIDPQGRKEPILTKNNPQELIDLLTNLKAGEFENLGDSWDDSPWLDPNMIHSIDLGHFNQGFGRDEEGRLYYSVSDIWDTASKHNAREGNTLGDLVEVASNAYPINLHGREYLEGNLHDIIKYNDRPK